MKTNKKIWVVSERIIPAIYAIIMCTIAEILILKADIVSKIFCFIGIIVAIIFLWLGYSAWLKWITDGKCDWKALLEWLIRDKSDKNSIQIRIAEVCFDLGYYDMCAEAIENLNKISSRFSPEENIRFRIIKIYYEAYINGYPSLKNEIEELISEIKSKEYKTEYVTCNLLKCYVEDDWEGVIECIRGARPVTVWGSVKGAYIVGEGYYMTESYELAYENLEYVRKWGGNTRYVAMANEMIEKMPDNVKNMEISPKAFKEYYRERFRMIACTTMVWLMTVVVWVIMFAQG